MLKKDTYTFFCYRADDDGTLHIALVVDDNAGVVLQRSELINTRQDKSW
jgi:hypothetical protein